ncbi:MAG: ATP-dependent DNA ligase, partial [Candidatus Eremiobacteraeota bacterium]|nr:ATP-dependent DNA ligase [Candidatus Eremiobacteraeota bacterium]
TYLVFDLLVGDDNASLVDVALSERRVRLEEFAKRCIAPGDPRLRLSPATESVAQVDAWYATVGGALDGVVAKRSDAHYRSGERDAVVKIKAIRSADCVVAGYRLAESGDAIGSLLLGLYDDAGRLDYVGFTSGFSSSEKRAVLQRLRPLHATASFDGKIPGGPSRWNRAKSTVWQALRPELVLEVSFDQVTSGRFRHGARPLRWRPDKLARSCTTDQIVARDLTLRLASL